MKIIIWFKSLFTNIPLPYGNRCWYFRKGKKISERQLFLEEIEKEKDK